MKLGVMTDSTYIGESSGRLEERVVEQAGRDRSSHVSKHSIEMGHKT